jgi:hypothetical protein
LKPLGNATPESSGGTSSGGTSVTPPVGGVGFGNIFANGGPKLKSAPVFSFLI